MREIRESGSVGGLPARVSGGRTYPAAVAMARALLQDPAFVRRLEQEEAARSACDHCNYCAARIYTTSVACHQREPPPEALRRHLEAG